MKKPILFIFLLLNNWMYCQISYPNAKKYLKDFLTIQSLLAENRTDDLKTFFANNDYYGENNIFIKLDKDLDNLEEYIFPGIYVRSGGKNEYADNYLDIIFFKRNANGNTINLSNDEVAYTKNIIQNLYKLGVPYPLIESYERYEKTNGINVEKINRYKYKIYSDKSPDKYYFMEASNFFNLSAIDKNLSNSIAFYGPGKALYTQITYFDPVESNTETGKFMLKMQLASVINKNSDPYDKFNVDFFMSLNDFNDRIWTDN